MTTSFTDRETERSWKGRKSRSVSGELRKRAVAKLVSVDIVTSMEEPRPLRATVWRGSLEIGRAGGL